MISLFERLREKALERKRRREERRQLRARASSGLGRVDPDPLTDMTNPLNPLSPLYLYPYTDRHRNVTPDGAREIYPVTASPSESDWSYKHTVVADPGISTSTYSPSSSDSSSSSCSSSDSGSSSSGGSD